MARPTFIENDTTMPAFIEKDMTAQQQQFSEMLADDANRLTCGSRTRRVLTTKSSRPNETAGPADQASAPATANQADCTVGASTAYMYEKEGSTFHLFLNESYGADYFQQDFEVTSSPSSSKIYPAPKRLCRRRRERQSYPKERHTILVAKDLLALIDRVTISQEVAQRCPP